MIHSYFSIRFPIFDNSRNCIMMDVRNTTLEVRNRAVGMLQGGITQINVAKEVGKSIRTIKRWWLKQ